MSMSSAARDLAAIQANRLRRIYLYHGILEHPDEEEQPAEALAPEQPEEAEAPEQPEEAQSPEQPEEGQAPDQLADALALEQPEETQAPDQPKETQAPDQPEETQAQEQPEEALAPEQPEEAWIPEHPGEAQEQEQEQLGEAQAPQHPEEVQAQQQPDELLLPEGEGPIDMERIVAAVIPVAEYAQLLRIFGMALGGQQRKARRLVEQRMLAPMLVELVVEVVQGGKAMRQEAALEYALAVFADRGHILIAYAAGDNTEQVVLDAMGCGEHQNAVSELGKMLPPPEALADWELMASVASAEEVAEQTVVAGGNPVEPWLREVRAAFETGVSVLARVAASDPGLLAAAWPVVSPLACAIVPRLYAACEELGPVDALYPPELLKLLIYGPPIWIIKLLEAGPTHLMDAGSRFSDLARRYERDWPEAELLSQEHLAAMLHFACRQLLSSLAWANAHAALARGGGGPAALAEARVHLKGMAALLCA